MGERQKVRERGMEGEGEGRRGWEKERKELENEGERVKKEV